jgi:hypothetical protein
VGSYVPIDPEETNAEQLDTSSKESIRKLRSLVDDLKSVEEHERSIVGRDDEPPLLG